MNEKAFRLDFAIAIAAVLVSVLSTLTLLYQTHVIGQQYAATIWPYLSVNAAYSANQERLTITNDGLGRALIHSAQLTVDGNQVTSWNQYLSILLADLPQSVRKQRKRALASMASVGASTTVRPGETKPLLEIDYRITALTPIILRHRVELSFCYCSLNNDCWMLHAYPGANKPGDNQSVHGCPVGAGIASDATPLRV